MKEDISSAAPTTAPNTSLGIKAGPIFIGKRNKDKNGKTTQGSQRPPMDTQIIMAHYDPTLDETLGPSATAGDWIHDFVHSKNPKFEGKSKKERIKMALGAYYHKEQLGESVEDINDHTKNAYHQTLTQHGFQHHSTVEKEFAGHKYTEHRYTHPSHGKSHVVVTHWHKDAKPHHYIHRHEQENGIMAPSSGENKNHLHRSLSRHYGVPKGMKAPKLTKWEVAAKVSPYKMNEGVIGPTRMQIQQTLSHMRLLGHTHNAAIHHTEQSHGIHSLKVNSKGDVVSYKHGHEFRDAAATGNPRDFAREDVITSLEDLDPVFEAYNKVAVDKAIASSSRHGPKIGGRERKLIHRLLQGRSTNALVSGEMPKTVAAHDPRSVKESIVENYADWHDEMEKQAKEGHEVQFKIKNAGGRTEAHVNGKKIGHYDHNTRKGHMTEGHYDDQKKLANAGRVHRPGSHSDNWATCHHCEQRAAHFEWHEGMTHSDASGAAMAEHMKAKSVKEDFIYEAGKNKSKEEMKRKYLGKTRGTTVTGKTAHQVVIDPIIKIDPKQTRGRQSLPAPDRGM